VALWDTGRPGMDSMGFRASNCAYNDAYKSDETKRAIGQACSLTSTHPSNQSRSRVLYTPYKLQAYSSTTCSDKVVGFIPRIGICTTGLVIAIAILRTFFVETFYIPSPSMEPMLHRDDHIVVSKVSYGLQNPFGFGSSMWWRAPSRGDVVVFRRNDDPLTKHDEGERAMVKRVVGVAGDIVAVSDDTVRVITRKRPLPKAVLKRLEKTVVSKRIYQVPENALFVMGDNSEVSYDSRFWRDPFVSLDRVVGKVSLVY
jgi:signal peptidase I